MRYQYKMLSTALIVSAQEMLCAITVDDDDHDEYHYHHHHYCKNLQIMTWDPAVKDKLERLSATLRKRSRAGEEMRRKTFIQCHENISNHLSCLNIELFNFLSLGVFKEKYAASDFKKL